MNAAWYNLRFVTRNGYYIWQVSTENYPRARWRNRFTQSVRRWHFRCFHPLEIAESGLAEMQNEKHLEIPHVTRPSSHSFLAEFLLIVVWFQLNYQRVKGGAVKAAGGGGSSGAAMAVVKWRRASSAAAAYSFEKRGKRLRERPARKSARTQVTIIATVFIIVAHSSALCTDASSAFWLATLLRLRATPPWALQKRRWARGETRN